MIRYQKNELRCSEIIKFLLLYFIQVKYLILLSICDTISKSSGKKILFMASSHLAMPAGTDVAWQLLEVLRREQEPGQEPRRMDDARYMVHVLVQSLAFLASSYCPLDCPSLLLNWHLRQC